MVRTIRKKLFIALLLILAIALGYKSTPLVQGELGETGASDELTLVNKEHPLPPEYVPSDLVVPNVPFSFAEDHPKKQMRQEAAEALENLFAAAAKDGIHLVAVSGFRSYERQEAIFQRNASQMGEAEANRVSARPGESEHQTGLAMDVSAASVDYRLTEEFGSTEEGRWLQNNAARFGFIIRYPKEKEHVTGYQYDPWHLRYVGSRAAQTIAYIALTFEEFLSQGNQRA